MLGYIVVGAAILILALAFDVLDPAKRAARRQRRDAYRATARRVADTAEQRDLDSWLDYPDSGDR